MRGLAVESARESGGRPHAAHRTLCAGSGGSRSTRSSPRRSRRSRGLVVFFVALFEARLGLLGLDPGSGPSDPQSQRWQGLAPLLFLCRVQSPRDVLHTGAVHAQLFVDTFFVMGGLLASLLDLSRAHTHGKDSDSRATLMAAGVHRYVRYVHCARQAGVEDGCGQRVSRRASPRGSTALYERGRPSLVTLLGGC